MNHETNIPIEAIKITNEIQGLFRNIPYYEYFKKIRIKEEDMPFTNEQENILNSYNLDEILENLLAESNGSKKVSYFGNIVKKEDRRLVYSSLIKNKDYHEHIGSLKPLDIFAYKFICPTCKHANNTVYKINDRKISCESCKHTYPFYNTDEFCDCSFCTNMLNKLKSKLEEFFLLFGDSFKLINILPGYENKRGKNEVNSIAEAITFIELYKKSMSNSDEYFEVGEEWTLEPKEIRDYDSFLLLYKKVQVEILEEKTDEYNQLIIKIDNDKNLVINFNEFGEFVSQKVI